MIIEREGVDVTLQDFAKRHGLTMRVTRHIDGRYSAAFKNTAAWRTGSFFYEKGDGASEVEAIHDYARTISLTRLIIDPSKASQREISVPTLIAEWRETEE